MTSMPMYLNTNAEHLKKLDDITDQDKIAVTSIKVSIPAIIMQMYAQEKYGPAQATRFDKFTVSMAHPDAVVALLSGSAGISGALQLAAVSSTRDAKIRAFARS